ncbi:MAG: ligase-associated DNA damage response endonuclease PdeM [Cyclobacteriaceae bacterium]
MTKQFDLEGQQLTLDASKAIFWYDKRMLFVSDVHLGKAGHFRKAGIPIPKKIHYDDLDLLSTLIARYQPKSLVFLGDLFHSDHNEEWNDFELWMRRHHDTEMILVKGNHDVLDENLYASSDLKIVEELILPPFHFSHEKVDSKLYNISGHIHPTIRLRGAARQGITLPCFYFDAEDALMPAFGHFTGGYKIKPAKGSRIFGVAEGKLIELVG